MCGDGANDCAALKAAHAGISLSEAEASIAAPFTSKVPDIRCVPTVIREGRAALVTSFGVFKYMAAYSLTQFTSIMMLYWIATNLTDFQFLYIDMFLITIVALFFGYTPASDRLYPIPPPTRLLSVPSVTSVLCQLVISISIQLTVFCLLPEFSWFVPYAAPAGDDGAENLRSMQSTGVFCASMFLYIMLALIYSAGKPHRKTMLTNWLLCGTLVVISSVSLYIAIWPPKWVESFLEFDPIPEVWFRVAIVLWSLIGCTLGWFCEHYFINGYLLETRETKQRLRRVQDPDSNSAKFEKLLFQYGKTPAFMRGVAEFPDEGDRISTSPVIFTVNESNGHLLHRSDTDSTVSTRF